MPAPFIGWSATFEIDDGSASAYVAVPNCTNIGVPQSEVSEVETTHLESANRRREFIGGLINEGTYPVTCHYSNETHSRLSGLLGETHNFRITTPTDDSAATITHEGYIASVQPAGFEPDVVAMLTFNVKVSGEITIA